jgi:hypothetical protein
MFNKYGNPDPEVGAKSGSGKKKMGSTTLFYTDLLRILFGVMFNKYRNPEPNPDPRGEKIWIHNTFI